MPYLIAALLPEPLRTEFGQLRTELDAWSGRWIPPHVTIVRPFTLDLEPGELAELRRPVQATAQIIAWSSFRNPGANVVFLEPTQEPFRHLRDDLFLRKPRLVEADTSADPYSQFAATPHYHITVSAHVPDNDIERIYSKVSQKTYLQVFQLTSLALFSLDRSGFWEEVR